MNLFCQTQNKRVAKKNKTFLLKVKKLNQKTSWNFELLTGYALKDTHLIPSIKKCLDSGYAYLLKAGTFSKNKKQ